MQLWIYAFLCLVRLVGWWGTGFCNWVSPAWLFWWQGVGWGSGSPGTPPKYPCCQSLLIIQNCALGPSYNTVPCKRMWQPNRRLGHAIQLVRQVNPSLHVPVSAVQLLFYFFSVFIFPPFFFLFFSCLFDFTHPNPYGCCTMSKHDEEQTMDKLQSPWHHHATKKKAVV